jgi:glycosyltransferase involved in cell wall biosynthesis
VRDAKALAAAIVELLEDRAKATKLAEKAREDVKARFSREAMVEGTLGVYRELDR